MWQYRSGKEICHQEDAARGGSKVEAEEKRKIDLQCQVKAALAKVLEIFDCPCGQRLKPISAVEVDRLR